MFVKHMFKYVCEAYVLSGVRICRTFYSTSYTDKKYLHKYIFKMNHAYIRCPQDSTTFELTFKYNNPEQKINKQFNFIRNLNENVAALSNRIKINMEKAAKKPKKKSEDEAPVEVIVKIFENEQEIDENVACSDLFLNGKKNIYLNLCDIRYNVIVNSPWIKSLTLPSMIMVGFLTYPNKFDNFMLNMDLTIFTWYKSVDKKEWNKIGAGFYYMPVKSDAESFLKLEILPKNEEHEGPITEVVSTKPVKLNELNFPFEERHSYASKKLHGNSFRVVTYNILADLYCDSDFTRETLFPYCPPEALEIDYRKQLILKELLGFNADFICLQEVDSKIFDNDLQPLLENNANLSGIYGKKGGTVREGLAFFYNKDRFNLKESNFLIIKDEITTRPILSNILEKIEKNSHLKERILERTTSLQIVVIESKENNNELLVFGNTHLYFHPDADHIRLLQGAACIMIANDVIEKLQENYPTKRISLVFCGDFNSTPDCGTYKLFTTGFVPENVDDWKSNEKEIVTGLKLEQNRIMASAYGTPKYTNYTDGFKDCLDYIYYELNKFIVSQVVPLPSLEKLQERTALPSVVFPSDHISLVADLTWVCAKNTS